MAGPSAAVGTGCSTSMRKSKGSLISWQAVGVASLTVSPRFNGPTRSGNGGWVAGALAAQLPDQSIGRPVTVTLRRPPPLGAPLSVTGTDAGVVLTDDGDQNVAEAILAEQSPVPVEPVDAASAAAAEAGYPGHRTHPFPDCFVCGPDRAHGDGLRIFPGPVPGAGRVAATWTPYESNVPVTWAALDCPGGWASDLEGRPAVLGRITVEVHRLPEIGEQHVVGGEERLIDGRKTLTASTLYGPGGHVVAASEHVWIAIDPAAFR